MKLDYKRRVPEEAKLSALLRKGKSLDDIAKAHGVKPSAVRLHAVRYGLIESRTGAARLQEARVRVRPEVRRGGDITMSPGRITFTRETHVAGRRGIELRNLSLPCPLIYQSAIEEMLGCARGGSHA